MKRHVPTGWELDLLQQQIDELFELISTRAATLEGGWAPACDLIELPDRFLVLLDLPGVGAEDIEVNLRHTAVEISGVKPAAGGGSETRRYERMERGFGPFSLVIQLPGPVLPGQSHARLRAGVLEVTLPRLDDRRDVVYPIPVSVEEP